MALVNCENCGAEVSDKAKKCPKCGKSIKKEETPIQICPECGTEVEKGAVSCKNCGYVIKKKKEKKKILVVSLIAVAVVAVVLCIFLAMTKNKGNKYILNACREIQSNLSNPNSLSLEEIYISDDVSTDTTIDYIYRVYIVYKYTNNYDRKKENSILYVIDDKGKTYFIEDSSNQKLYSYKSIAEVEIYGLSGWFEPSDNWTKLESSEVDKIERKID